MACVERIRSELDGCSVDDLKLLSQDIKERLAAADRKARLTMIKQKVQEHGWCVCETKPDIEHDEMVREHGLACCKKTVEFLVLSYDMHSRTDISITELSDEQQGWVKSLKYEYPDEDVKGSTNWDEGPRDWEWGSQGWYAPDVGKVWRNVWIYVNVRPLQCPPPGTHCKVLYDSEVLECKVTKQGLRGPDELLICKRTEWPSRGELTDWFILKTTPAEPATNVSETTSSK